MGFDDYNFSEDENFLAYVKNKELSGNATDQAAQMKRLQTKWYIQNVDPSFTPPSASTAPPSSNKDRKQQEEPKEQSTGEHHNGKPGTGWTQAWTQQGPHSDKIILGLNAFMQAAMILLCITFLFTFITQNRRLNLIVYRLYMQVATASHLTRIVSTFGFPTVWPFSWPRIQQWLAQVAGTSDAHYTLVCFTFMTQPPNIGVMGSPMLFAILRLASYLRRNFATRLKAVSSVCDKILARKEDAFVSMAVLDVSALGILLATAFSQRALLLPYMYVSLLRHRYRAPVSAKYHQAVWRVISGYVQPVMKYMPSPVHKAIGWVVQWFTGAPM